MSNEITPISALNLLKPKDKKDIAVMMRNKARKHGIDLREKGITRRLISEGLANYNKHLNDARLQECRDREEYLNKRKMRKGKHRAMQVLRSANPQEYDEQIKKAKDEGKKKKFGGRKSRHELVFPLVVNCINSAIIAESKSRQLPRPDESKEAAPALMQADKKKFKKRKIIKIFEKAVKKLKPSSRS